MKITRKPGRPVNKRANCHHPLYASWRSHRARGNLLTTTFREFLDRVALAGWRPDVGYRVFVDPLTEEITVYKAIHDFAEYRLWIRMMSEGSVGGKSTVCVAWHDFFEFREWVLSFYLDGKIDFTNKSVKVARQDSLRFFNPANSFLTYGVQ